MTSTKSTSWPDFTLGPVNLLSMHKELPVVCRFLKKVEQDSRTGCWNWTAACDVKGYGRFHLDDKWKGAHRVSYELFVDEIKNDLHVLHMCDNPACVRPDHLFLGTNQDNMDDAKRKHRFPAGEDKPAAKLKAADIPVIRGSKGVYTCTELAAHYGVAHTTIVRIWNYEAWTHIT